MKKSLNAEIKQNPEILLYAAWLVSITALLGSLFFSDVLKLVPCKLCWIQRICMYPLVFIIGVGLSIKDRKVPYYILPLSSIGFIVAFYHVLLYKKILPEAVGFCEAGISCTTKYVEYFGIFSIPMLSLIAFTLITALSIYYLKVTKND
jgi:disulfide bond formation protein DsbB